MDGVEVAGVNGVWVVGFGVWVVGLDGVWEVGPPGRGSGRSRVHRQTRGTGSGAALHSLVIRRLRSEGFGRVVTVALFRVAPPLAAGWS